MKVSFDFDGTLSRKDFQLFAKCFPVNVGHFEWEESCRDILKINLVE